MVMVDVYVPYLNSSYDFSLDETATISSLINEIAALICLKEHWPVPATTDKLSLFLPAQKRMLAPSSSLIREDVTSGQRLVLC